MSRGKGKVQLSEIKEVSSQLESPASGASGEIHTESPQKKKKVKAESGQLDPAMYKVHSKYAPQEEQELAYAPQQPQSWEIDPSKLSLSQKLGQGTFGTVHRGTYMGKDVAVKIFNWDDGTGSRSQAEISYYRGKFLREINIMSSLNHPHITQFIGAWPGGREFQIPSTNMGDSGTYTLKSTTCCLLMEFVEGGSIRNLWINFRRAGRSRMPYNICVQICLDTARGLAYLHSKKICHRDLKPDNLLLDASQRVKIADFGESRLESPLLTDMSKRTGTYGYMAPEVLDPQQNEGYNHKCDVFSYGICVWEIYCCNIPFNDLEPGLCIRDMTIQICKEGRRPTIPLCCPTFLRNLMEKCWDVDPSKRPEMQEVVDMIENSSQADCCSNTQRCCDIFCVFCMCTPGL